MTMSLKALIAASIVVSATGSFARSPLPSSGEIVGTGSGPEAAEEKPKRICRKIVPTGTMLARSFCLTAAEWKQFEAENDANHGRNRTTMATPLPTAD